MKINKLIFVGIGVPIFVGSLFIAFKGSADERKTNISRSPSDKVDTALIGVPKSASGSFQEDLNKAGIFYDFYNEAKQDYTAGNFDSAILKLNKSLEYVALKNERAMVYGRLAETYRAMGDQKMEIQNLELERKWNLSKKHDSEIARRLDELQAKNVEGKSEPKSKSDQPPQQ